MTNTRTIILGVFYLYFWHVNQGDPQEAAFRQEIDKATERLEGVQKHVLLQVSEAREAQKQAETQFSKAVQKNEQVSTEVQKLRGRSYHLPKYPRELSLTWSRRMLK